MKRRGESAGRHRNGTPGAPSATFPGLPATPGGRGTAKRSAGGRQAVVAAIITRGQRVLVARRGAPRRGSLQGGAPDTLEGYWEFPGGKVEPGESWEVALRREMREELGVEVTLAGTEPVHRVPWDYDHLRVELIALPAQITAGEPRPLDHRELKWVDAKELPGLNLLPADRPIAEIIAGQGIAVRQSSAQ